MNKFIKLKQIYQKVKNEMQNEQNTYLEDQIEMLKPDFLQKQKNLTYVSTNDEEKLYNIKRNRDEVHQFKLKKPMP